ncbi:periplasmic binding protein [Clostridiales bacterium KA00134]|nr:periplasmic binding protein [Clostridiales bacterium KA00134]
MKRKILKILFAVIILSMMLVGCKNKENKKNGAESETTKQTETANKDGEYREVVDQAGRTVKVPKDPKRVVITFWPMGSAYTLFQGSAETIVGMDPAMVSVAKNSLLTRIDPNVANVDSSFINADGVINEESLMKLNPDLALIPAYATDQLEIFEKLGVPTIVFDVTVEDYNTVETFMSWVDLLGKAFGKESKATAIREYGEKTLKEIAERTKNLSEADKPKALLLISYDESGKSTSGEKQFARFELESTGAIHVARDVKENFIKLDMEQIYKWNPDIIYLSTFTAYKPEDLYNNTAAANDDWSQVKAVKNKNVHKFPIGIFHWYPPSADAPLALLWLAKNNNPDLFKDVDLSKRIKDYYKDLYDIELSDADIDFIFNPSSEVAN